MAAPGYVVVMMNPRGSTGYGSRFTEEITRDWGGRVYTDLMNGVDAAIAKYPFIDGSRLAAAGGSFGGFMIDWIATHSGRFKCLISHAGPYDARSMFATEELWFQEWEYGGTPWEHPELYDKWSSEKFAGALGKFKTPTLVIGGELDFRIPYTQELEFFTALQRQGVPSKLVIFPDEGHWVLKPPEQPILVPHVSRLAGNISEVAISVPSHAGSVSFRFYGSTPLSFSGAPLFPFPGKGGRNVLQQPTPSIKTRTRISRFLRYSSATLQLSVPLPSDARAKHRKFPRTIVVFKF